MMIMRCLMFYLLLMPVFVYGAYPTELPANTPASTKWVFAHANACLKDDNITRIAANGECLALQTYWSSSLPKPQPNLLVFIHGDGIPGGGPSDYLKLQATKFVNSHTVSVVLIRPGYYDSYGHYSTGESYAFAGDGYPNDSYRPHTVATLASAIKQLKHFYHAHCTILVGHSGGAMMSGIILGKYPGLANGAVLASVVGNVHAWAKKHHWGDYAHSLSPNNFVKTIPKQDFVYIVSGDHDKNTYPAMAKAYYQQLLKAGVNAHWMVQVGGNHNTTVLAKSSMFDKAIKKALLHCEK